MIGDIDILITGNLKRVVNKLMSLKYVVATLSLGTEKFSGVVRIPKSTNYRKIDIIQTTKKEMPFALLYFTGDVVQNISMRRQAKTLNYSLSQHGLKKLNTGKYITSVKTEKDIFKLLGLQYKPPGKRTHPSE